MRGVTEGLCRPRHVLVRVPEHDRYDPDAEQDELGSNGIVKVELNRREDMTKSCSRKLSVPREVYRPEGKRNFPDSQQN